MITCSVLVALGRDDEQRTHFRGARNAGISRPKLEAMITHVAHYAGWPVASQRATHAPRGVDDDGPRGENLTGHARRCVHTWAVPGEERRNVAWIGASLTRATTSRVQGCDEWPRPSGRRSRRRRLRSRGRGEAAARWLASQAQGRAAPSPAGDRRELFSSQGFLGTSTRELAEHAGVSETLMFRYFGAKVGLFREALVAPFVEFVEDFNAKWQAGSNAELDDDSLTRHYIGDLFDRFGKNRGPSSCSGRPMRRAEASWPRPASSTS